MFLDPLQKMFNISTSLEFRFTPWRTLVCHFLPLPKHQEWHTACDLHPTSPLLWKKNENPPLIYLNFFSSFIKVSLSCAFSVEKSLMAFSKASLTRFRISLVVVRAILYFSFSLSDAMIVSARTYVIVAKWVPRESRAASENARGAICTF